MRKSLYGLLPRKVGQRRISKYGASLWPEVLVINVNDLRFRQKSMGFSLFWPNRTLYLEEVVALFAYLI